LNGVDLSDHLDALQLPPEYAYSRNEDILTCLRECNRDGTVETRRMKVMMVGPSGAGKTTLVHRLRTFEYLPNAQTTDGIEVSDLNRHDVTLHLWDFGGHPDLLKTHHIFFSNRAVFLLVFDPRRDKVPDLESYLQAVRGCAPDAPLVLVLTHCAELTALPQSTLDEIAQRFGPFAGFAAVDSLTGAALDGIQTFVSGGLAELLPAVAKAQPYGTQKVPRQLLKLQQHLSQLSKPPHNRFHMSATEFHALAQEQFGMSAEASEQVLGLLHDWGVVYVLPGGEQVVLAPQQLSQVLQAAVKGGPLEPSRADEVWQQYDSELRPLFLALLRECGLVAEQEADS
jgi:GTPase SAR1 family protein